MHACVQSYANAHADDLLCRDAALGAAIPHAVQQVNAGKSSSGTASLLRLDNGTHVAGCNVAHEVCICSVPVPLVRGRVVVVLNIGIHDALMDT